LRVWLERVDNRDWFWGGAGMQYVYQTLEVGVPDNLPVEIYIGSGDAWVRGVASLSVRVGSGDLEAREIPGAVSLKIESGDAELDMIGSLHVDYTGSGDLKARHVRGAVMVGNLGSGDIELEDVTGDVEIGSISSGDVEIERVRGNLTIGSIDSGDLKVEDISGDFIVRSKGSGDIHHQQVRGTVEIPRRR